MSSSGDYNNDNEFTKNDDIPSVLLNFGDKIELMYIQKKYWYILPVQSDERINKK